MKPKEKKQPKELKATLTFLEQTKDGKYAEINKGALIYSRLEIRREAVTTNGAFLFGVR